MRPDQTVEVNDTEYLDLTRMGLVLPEPEEVEQRGEQEPEADVEQAPVAEEV